MTRLVDRSGWGKLLLFAAAVAAAGAAHRDMDTSAPLERGELFVPRPEHARASSLGFEAVLSDYYWLQAVQLLGRERAGIGKHSLLVARLIDVVTTLDPWVGHPYRFAAVWLTDSPESVRAANRLLERAIAHHPDDWRNRHYLGFNEFFYLGEDARAADDLEAAVGLPGAPRYLASLVAKLRLQRDGLETAAAFLTELAAGASDEYARAAYLKALDEVQVERSAQGLDRAREAYRARFGRDIERVQDLLRGDPPVLRALPPAHPHFAGFRWMLDDEGRIVSSFYRARYRPFVQREDEERRQRWRRQIEAERSGGAEG